MLPSESGTTTEGAGETSEGAFGAQMVTTAAFATVHADARLPRVFLARYQKVPPPGTSSTLVTVPATVATADQSDPFEERCNSKAVAVLAGLEIVTVTAASAFRAAETAEGGAGVL